MQKFQRKYDYLHLNSSTIVTDKNGENYILMSFVLLSDYHLRSYYDVPGKWSS
jgi:hypothetical protein